MCTVEDPLLVREDADILPQRLSQRYGHLICFPVLTERERVESVQDQIELKAKKNKTKNTIWTCPEGFISPVRLNRDAQFRI